MVPPRPAKDVSYHSSSGTGVYWPQMDVGTAMQSHGVTGLELPSSTPETRVRLSEGADLRGLDKYFRSK